MSVDSPTISLVYPLPRPWTAFDLMAGGWLLLQRRLSGHVQLCHFLSLELYWSFSKSYFPRSPQAKTKFKRSKTTTCGLAKLATNPSCSAPQSQRKEQVCPAWRAAVPQQVRGLRAWTHQSLAGHVPSAASVQRKRKAKCSNDGSDQLRCG